MSSSFDIWKMLAGVAIFLLGMNFLEETSRHLAGRSFKLFLKKHTANRFKAIFGGTIVTGVLQSSSVVNLMVLAFVGAGVIKMQNALAIILGANLGSTFNSWIIATVGFNFNIESFALPVAGVSGIAMMLINKESRWHQWCKLIFGLSFLFIGLNYIKTGIEDTMKQVDLSLLNEQPAILFLLLGFLITSLIQSSSATVAIALSALHVNAIGLFSATAIVLGSEIGTTIKLVLASMKGLTAKKRVALGNLLFNIISTVIIFIFLHPVNRFITDVAGIKDNLVALVFFQSLVNVAGIVLFYPFLGVFGRFLEKRFQGNTDEQLFISKTSTADAGLALDALEKQTQHFIFHVLKFTENVFEVENKSPENMLNKNFQRKTIMEKYEYIKTMHGEMHGFVIQLQPAAMTKNEALRLAQIVSCVRNCMYAAKSIRDALHDIEQLHNSSNDTKYNFYLRTKEKIESFSRQLYEMMEQPNADKNFETITGIFKSTQEGYTQSLEELYKEGMDKHVNQVEISTLINFNREMYTAFKSFVFALKDYLLEPEKADYFEDLPGFIR